ncbi:DUF2164 domain-containing protein [Paenibacillus sp. LHD-117]|uniref:DUF2164 domain-containing protein n=1 Tax=Paenibacillus sp. LHD-117 TaxID=3071412 RepID=UPI0027E1CC33|nr:DUF2164 domain-containing protein [Paenibacillus sp. LHD-117]MDQ6418748.1 DUF2164 domain-containing protein [Paenibacillus sp. LHD-117]
MTIMKMPRETKLQLVSELRSYLEKELDLEIGELAGEQFLDHLLKLLTPPIYNQAIDDARKVIEQRMAATDEDLYALQKSAPLSGRR